MNSLIKVNGFSSVGRNFLIVNDNIISDGECLQKSKWFDIFTHTKTCLFKELKIMYFLKSNKGIHSIH